MQMSPRQFRKAVFTIPLALHILLFDCASAFAPQVEISDGDNEVLVTPGDTLGLSILRLNRVTFKPFVLDDKVSSHVDHIFVHFCLSWWKPCENFAGTYTSVAIKTQNKFNIDLFRSKVRFAYVDCAKDKELCNIMGQNDFPAVAHYSSRYGFQHRLAQPPPQNALSIWRGNGEDGQPSFESWLTEVLNEYDTSAKATPSLRDLVPDMMQAYTTTIRSMRALRVVAANETVTLTYLDTEGDNITVSTIGGDMRVYMNGERFVCEEVLLDKESGLLRFRRDDKKGMVADIPFDFYDKAQHVLDATVAHSWVARCTEWVDNHSSHIQLSFHIVCMCFFCIVGLHQYARKRYRKPLSIENSRADDSRIQKIARITL